jgi:hypothetical protein
MNFDVQYPDNGNEQKAVVTRVDGDPVLYVTSVLGSESLTTGRYKLYKADKQTSRLLTEDGRYTVQPELENAIRRYCRQHNISFT